MTDTDPRAEAIRALAYRLADRDTTPADERCPPEVFANEFISALKGQGWRHLPALTTAPPPATTKPPPPVAVHRYASQMRATMRTARHPGGAGARSA